MSEKRKRTQKIEQLRQMELLHLIGIKIISVFDLDALLTTVAQGTAVNLGYENCAIFLTQGNNLVLKAAYDFPRKMWGTKISIGEGVVGMSAHKKKIINISDISKCSFYISSGLKNIRSEIAIPITWAKQFLGVMTIESTKKNAFSKDDERILGILSSQLGVAIRNVRLTQSKEKEMALLHRTGLKIVSKMELDKLLSTILNLIRKSLGYDNCALFLPVNNRLIVKAQTHFPKRILGMEIKTGEGIVGRCAKTKKPVYIPDVLRCTYYIPSGLEEVQSALALPILYENRLMAVLATESRTLNAFSEDDLRLLGILSSQIGVALRNAEMHEELKRKVITDSLTGLYNHRYFISRLEEEAIRARRYKRELSLILIDLDDFKLVNDLFGHLIGDDVLIAAAKVILNNTRKTDKSAIMKNIEIDIAVRYGGEEFMIILPETSLKGALIAAERLRQLLKEGISSSVRLVQANGEQMIVSGSFGVACLREEETSEDLIKRVDQAMYEAKKRGKDSVFSLD